MPLADFSLFTFDGVDDPSGIVELGDEATVHGQDYFTETLHFCNPKHIAEYVQAVLVEIVGTKKK